MYCLLGVKHKSAEIEETRSLPLKGSRGKAYQETVMKEWLCAVQARNRRVAGLPLLRGEHGRRIYQEASGPLVLTLLTEQTPGVLTTKAQDLARKESQRLVNSCRAKWRGSQASHQPELLALGSGHQASLKSGTAIRICNGDPLMTSPILCTSSLKPCNGLNDSAFFFFSCMLKS